MTYATYATSAIQYSGSLELPQGCQLHKTHQPKNLTVEWHHLIPVAWQLHTTLTIPPPFPGIDPDGRGELWDCRGIWLCPTGHRNVHRWIVAMMMAAKHAGTTDPAAARAAILPRGKEPVELEIAFTAPARFMDEASGSSEPNMNLLTLVAAGEYGEA